MTMKYFFLIFVSLNHLCSISGQQATFSKKFSNFPLNAVNGVLIKEMDNGYILLSAAGCLSNTDETCCNLTKLDYNGNVEWYKEYPFHPGSSTMVVNDGKIYVSGHTHQANAQFTLYCIDSLGDVIWNKMYGIPSKNCTFPRLTYWDNNWVLFGAIDTILFNIQSPMAYFVRTDLNGNFLSDYYFGENFGGTAAIKMNTTSTNTGLASFAYCPGNCSLDLGAGVMALDSNDQIIWKKLLPPSFSNGICVASQTDAETIAVQWHVDNNGIPDHDLTPPATYYLNMSGELQDVVVYHNQTLKRVRDMESLWNNGFVAAGNEYVDYINQGYDLSAGWLMRVDGNRDVIWERSYLDTTFNGRADELISIMPTKDGGFIASGIVSNWMTGVWESHNWVLKLDSMGCLIPGCGEINYLTNLEEPVFLKGQFIQVYPNPTTESVYIELPDDFNLSDGAVAEVFSAGGSFINRTKLYAQTTLISLGRVEPGQYVVLVRLGNEIIAVKRVAVVR